MTCICRNCEWEGTLKPAIGEHRYAVWTCPVCHLINEDDLVADAAAAGFDRQRALAKES